MFLQLVIDPTLDMRTVCVRSIPSQINIDLCQLENLLAFHASQRDDVPLSMHHKQAYKDLEQKAADALGKIKELENEVSSLLHCYQRITAGEKSNFCCQISNESKLLVMHEYVSKHMLLLFATSVSPCFSGCFYITKINTSISFLQQ